MFSVTLILWLCVFTSLSKHGPLIESTGPPKLVVTPTKLTLLDPFHRGLSQSNSEVSRPPHYTKTRAPAISSQSQPRNGHLSVSAAPACTETTAQPARKMGVASLLFHRTLSPKDTLQVHSYTLEKQQPHTQLQVHSYAREHQPRHLHHRAFTPSHTQVHPSYQAPSCERTETQPESKSALTKVTLNQPEAQSPAEQREKEDKPKVSLHVEPRVAAKVPEVEATSTSSSPQTQTQPRESSQTEMEAPKNSKRKVCPLFVSCWVCLIELHRLNTLTEDTVAAVSLYALAPGSLSTHFMLHILFVLLAVRTNSLNLEHRTFVT